jgi:hypothetical protein
MLRPDVDLASAARRIYQIAVEANVWKGLTEDCRQLGLAAAEMPRMADGLLGHYDRREARGAYARLLRDAALAFLAGQPLPQWRDEGLPVPRRVARDPAALSGEASSLWDQGASLIAGQLWYDAIPTSRRPSWAARVLGVSLDLLHAPAWVGDVIAIADTPTKWPDARRCFEELRRRLLVSEREHEGSPTTKLAILLAENVAKVTYNATRPSAPYDHDAGYHIAELAHRVGESTDGDSALRSIRAVLFDPELLKDQ